MTLKHEVHESEKRTERSEHFNGETDDYDYYMSVREDGFVTVGFSPRSYNDRMRLPAFQMHPKYVADIEHAADALPALLRQFAAELRELGKDDLRSNIDKMMDESRASMDRYMATIREKSATEISGRAVYPDGARMRA